MDMVEEGGDFPRFVGQSDGIQAPKWHIHSLPLVGVMSATQHSGSVIRIHVTAQTPGALPKEP